MTLATFAFLLSRRPRALAPDSWWLLAMQAAAAWAVERKMTFVSGDDPFAQRVARRIVSRLGGETIAIPTPPGKRATSWALRDRRTIEAADLLIALAIRPGGIMEKLAREALPAGKEVRLVAGETPAAVASRLVEAGASPLTITIVPPPAVATPLPEEIPRADSGETGFLWHFTRSTPGPWPGQSEEEYIDALIENAPGAAHTAGDALARIIAENRIRACGRLIKGAAPVVCLTEAAPAEILAVRRYRPALLRWDFEPAAIGVPLAAAERLGLRPVVYGAPGEEKNLSRGDRHLFQKHLPPEIDFTHEKEWRSAGDLDLSRIAPEEMRIYLPK